MAIMTREAGAATHRRLRRSTGRTGATYLPGSQVSHRTQLSEYGRVIWEAFLAPVSASHCECRITGDTPEGVIKWPLLPVVNATEERVCCSRDGRKTKGSHALGPETNLGQDASLKRSSSA
ncbi:hypothetical protein BO71DRAFT_407317 [Aspergillus ellipticus CBS 707.79]|uniref:Uncharacterized protein n=1 Tax=Aspergillus ellipticus CBS 707.79 TaxID=1448320 RepID=A0A319DZN7_9EURO|nr:hypothetical protein BO71DRAFT_407317 [Aspergillus ellipticus CBS 707.79]